MIDKQKQRGSITLFVLISVLFFIVIAIATYTQISNKATAQEKELNNIEEKYEVTDDEIEDEYNEQIDKEENRIMIMLYEKTENTSEPKKYYKENKWYNINDNDFILDVIFYNKQDKKTNKVTVTNANGVSTTKTQEEIEKNGPFIITENCTIIAEAKGARKKFEVSKIDKELPQINFTENNPKTIMIEKNKTTTITSPNFSGVDKISTVKTIKYGFVNSNTLGTVPEDYVTVNGNNITPLEKQVGVGNYYLWIQIEDIAGNINTVYSQPIIVIEDNISPTKPTITVDGSENWTNKDVTITISGSTDNFGMSRYEVSLDEGKTWQKIEGDKITFTENTNKEIWFRGVDTSDNASEVVKKWVRIDKTIPTIKVTPSTASISKNTNITITATDEGGSGLLNNTSYQYQLSTSKDTVPTGTWNNYTSGTPLTIGNGLTGTYYLWIREIKDIAGNTSNKDGTKVGNCHVFGTYIFDNQGPSINIGTNGGTYTILAGQSSVQARTQVTMTDVGNSGASKLEISWSTNQNSEPNNWTTITNGATITENLTGGDYYLWVRATDNIGNSTIKVSNVFRANYQIVYNANGGSGAPGNQTKTHNVNLTLSSTRPSRQGYTFAGWSTSSSATSANYQPGSTYTNNQAITLYAVWQEVKYTVTITNSNGSVYRVSGTPGSRLDLSSYETGSTDNVYYTVYFNGNGVGSPNSSSLSDYETRSKSYSLISGYGSVSGSTYTFGNGDGNVRTSIISNDNARIRLPSIYLNSDWTFNGWYTSSSGGSYVGGSGTTINAKTYSGRTLYAHGNPPSYDHYLHYNANGGSGAPSSQSITTSSSGYTFTVTYSKPSRSGYTFLGWATYSSASSPSYTGGDNIYVSGSTTLYAVWQKPNNPPRITISPNSNSTWKKKHTVTVSITDPDGDSISEAKRKWLDKSSGVSQSNLTVDISNPSNESITGSGMTGTYYLWVYARDSRGGETLTHSGGFRYDGEDPTISATVSGSSGKTAYLTATATEPRNQGHDPSGLEKLIYLKWPGLKETEFNNKWFSDDLKEEIFFTSGARQKVVLKHEYAKGNEHRGQIVHLKSRDGAGNESSVIKKTIPSR